MSEQRIMRWKDMAALLEQGWRLDRHELVSPTGARRGVWLNAIASCRKRGLVPEPSTSSEPTTDR